jgi:hypothetical protein
MAMNEVWDFVAAHESQIASLASDPQFYVKPGQIHMRRFADAVCNLISAD